MNILKMTFFSNMIVLLGCSTVLSGEHEKTMERDAEMSSKCDIGYKVSFLSHDAIPYRVDILIHDKNINRAIGSFRAATLENINDDLAKDSRVCFVWRSENNEKSAVWSFSEKDGKVTPLFPASGPATRAFNGLHPKSKFLAVMLTAECELV